MSDSSLSADEARIVAEIEVKWNTCRCETQPVCLCVQNALQFIKQCWKMQGRPLFLVLIREDNIK